MKGPFVKMSELITSLATVELGSSFEGTMGNEGGGGGGGGGGEKVGLKRKHDGTEDEELLRIPPVNDIYRSRQQKRVHPA